MTQETRIYNGENGVSSINGAGKTRQICVNLTPQTKINHKWIKGLNISVDAIKLKCRTLTDINHSQIFQDPPLRVMKIKVNYWNLVKLKSFCKTKETIKK